MLLFCCDVLVADIYKRFITECYCVCFECGGSVQYRKELILNVIVFVVKVWVVQFREELILNVTLFFFF
jgi:hypothetical protein